MCTCNNFNHDVDKVYKRIAKFGGGVEVVTKSLVLTKFNYDIVLGKQWMNLTYVTILDHKLETNAMLVLIYKFKDLHVLEGVELS